MKLLFFVSALCLTLLLVGCCAAGQPTQNKMGEPGEIHLPEPQPDTEMTETAQPEENEEETMAAEEGSESTIPEEDSSEIDLSKADVSFHDGFKVFDFHLTNKDGEIVFQCLAGEEQEGLVMLVKGEPKILRIEWENQQEVSSFVSGEPTGCLEFTIEGISGGESWFVLPTESIEDGRLTIFYIQ